MHHLRTKTLVLELLAAVCRIDDGHRIVLEAFDNFKIEYNEKYRFETLMFYFQNNLNDEENINMEFMVLANQFVFHYK